MLTAKSSIRSRRSQLPSAAAPSRRAFLKATVAAGGGLLLHATLPPLARAAMTAAPEASGEPAALNTFQSVLDGAVSEVERSQNAAQKSAENFLSAAAEDCKEQSLCGNA